MEKHYFIRIFKDDPGFLVNVMNKGYLRLIAENVLDFSSIIDVVEKIMARVGVGFGYLRIPAHVIAMIPRGDTREWRFCEECLRKSNITGPYYMLPDYAKQIMEDRWAAMENPSKESSKDAKGAETGLCH